MIVKLRTTSLPAPTPPPDGASSSPARRPGSGTRQPLRWPGGARRFTSWRGIAAGRSGPGTRHRGGVRAASAISYGLADLEDLDAVRAFARQFRATHDRLDVLIHNAGAIHPQFRTDAAGTELTILGPGGRAVPADDAC